MSQLNLSEVETDMFSDNSILQSKIREKFFELSLKRKLLDETRSALTKLDSEKHMLIQKLEKSERQLSDVNIHLQVAIKAAREAEAERSTARELMARQGAQLEAASKEREHLQQGNRALQIEVDEMKRELEDAKSKILSQTHFLDLIKKKDAQNKAIIETLSLEISKLEKSLTDLKELCSKIVQVTKIMNTLLNQQKQELSKLREEKLELQEKIISLTAQTEELKLKPLALNTNSPEKKVLSEWEKNQEEMQKRLKNCEEENQLLQTSLDNAIFNIKQLQSSEDLLKDKIKCLEETLEATMKTGKSIENKEIQTPDYFEGERELHAMPS